MVGTITEDYDGSLATARRLHAWLDETVGEGPYAMVVDCRCLREINLMTTLEWAERLRRDRERVTVAIAGLPAMLRASVDALSASTGVPLRCFPSLAQAKAWAAPEPRKAQTADSGWGAIRGDAG